ncbi:MAG: Mrp/NBP35 family ATP-binding protein, partial [Planctomycetota bacterium]
MSNEHPAQAKVQEVLAGFLDPESGRSVTQMEQVKALTVDAQQVQVTLGLTTYGSPLWEETREDLKARLQAALPEANIDVQVVEHERKAEPLGQIGLSSKAVIAVGSGKGGVGKSTIAVALAWALKRAGCKVGLMDADVYGPSVPHLLGLSGRPEVIDKRIQPADKDGLKVMSMGFLVPEDEAVVWRGPMLHGAITQFLRDTAWGELDYLIIDMPPGTGDIALTLSQLLPLTGSVVVCTPQKVALLDAVKAIAMFGKVNIPVLGVVENMSGFICDSGKEYELFGKGGAQQAAEERQVPFLGSVPIHMGIRESGDLGQMEVTFDDPLIEPTFSRISYQLVKNLAT